MVSVKSHIGRFGLAAAAALLVSPDIARADESGISFWLPGLYGSLSATPHHARLVSGHDLLPHFGERLGSGGGLSGSPDQRNSPNRHCQPECGPDGQADLQFIAPTYTFAEPVLGEANCRRRWLAFGEEHGETSSAP